MARPSEQETDVLRTSGRANVAAAYKPSRVGRLLGQAYLTTQPSRDR